MNGFFLLIPFLLIRFALLALLDRSAVGRAARFAPMSGAEVPAYWIYQISNLFIFVHLCFLPVVIQSSWRFFLGLALYLLGLAACAASVASFAAPSDHGPQTGGAYRFSRNPMYVSYFLFFLGCAALTQSLLLFCAVLIFQISSHWIILAEERWCAAQFGASYRQYLAQVRRYL